MLKINYDTFLALRITGNTADIDKISPDNLLASAENNTRFTLETVAQ